MMTHNHNDAIPVAVTGLACRFPQDGRDVHRFWDLICGGTSAWTEIPSTRFKQDAFPPGIPKGGHFLSEDISRFDANFFRISHAEASAMDPQQRLMLEVAYEALEASGFALESVAGTKTGVFMGQFTSDYKELVSRDAERSLPFSMTGLQPTSLSNRISWLFDLKGPSFTVDTACSSSLVALHLACQSLRNGESDLAIVGGCNLMINPDMFIFQSGQGFLSPDGKCKAFDVSADGYGRGEGFAVIVLKRADDAVASSDPIRAVIRATGSNQDGHTKGFTLPSIESQAALIRDVYRKAGLDFSQTSYVEAHGTGTQAGDLRETTALAQTIGAGRTGNNKLIVGSVKPNIGHLEAAAGLAGVVKSILMLESGTIPPNILFNTPNPKIEFNDWNIRIPTALTQWPTAGLRRISVNSFGYGGSNAHAILDDAQSFLSSREGGSRVVHFTKGGAGTNGVTHMNGNSKGASSKKSSPATPRIFVISAQDKDGIGRVKKSLAESLAKKAKELHTAEEQDDYLDDLAFTLNGKRSHLQWKTYVVAWSLDELTQALQSEDLDTPVYLSSQKPRLGFVFTGQGAQWPTMGMELMAYPTFRESIEAADAFLRESLGSGWSAAEELARGKSTSKLRQAEYSQALCTVLQVALVDLLREWKIEPTAVAGHSSGEIAAAYCLGVLSREDAWTAAFFRGLLSSQVRSSGVEGGMMAVGASPEQATKAISEVEGARDKVVVACVNSPQSVTVSGDADGIDALLEALQERKVFARKLQVDTAYHSPHMQLVAQEYMEAIMDIEPKPALPGRTMYSSVHGGVAQAEELGPAYWVRNLLSPVQFASAIQTLAKPSVGSSGEMKKSDVDLLLEIGPHSALQGPAAQSLKTVDLADIPYYSVLTRGSSAVDTAVKMSGTLFAHGFSANFSEVNKSSRIPRLLVDLPSYPWNHSQSHWSESRVGSEYRLRQLAHSPSLGAPAPSLVAGERVWRGNMRLSDKPWLADHKIQGTVLYPAAGYVALAVEAMLATADANAEAAAFRLRDIHLKSAMTLEEQASVEYNVCLRPHLLGIGDSSGTWTEFDITTCRAGETSLESNCSGLIMIEYKPAGATASGQDNSDRHKASLARFQNALDTCETTVKPQELYQRLESIGFQYGPAFQNVLDVHTRPGLSCGSVGIPEIEYKSPSARESHVLHPGTLDAVFHLAFAALWDSPGGMTQAMVPKAIDELVIMANIPREAGQRIEGFSTAVRDGYKQIVANMVMTDETRTRPVLRVSGLQCTELGGASAQSDETDTPKSISSKVVWRPTIDLLYPQELADVIKRAAAAQASQDDGSASSAAVAIAEYIKLVHHVKPDVTISELVEDAANDPPILSNRSGLADVVKTADCSIWCASESARDAAEESLQGSEDVRIEVRDLAGNAESSESKSDLIIIPAASAATGRFEEVMKNAVAQLSSDGSLCLTVPVEKAQAVEYLGKAMKLHAWVKIEGLDGLTVLIGSGSAVSGHQTNGVQHSGNIVILQSQTPSQTVTELAKELQESLVSLGYGATIVPWDGSNTASWKGASCISLLEIDSAILQDVDEETFARIKPLILDTEKLLWVSGLSDTATALVRGLARSVRNEEPGLNFHTLHADMSPSSSSPIDRTTDLILRALHNTSGDNEYMIKDDALQVSRVLEDDAVNSELHRLDPQHNKTITNMKIGDVGGPLKLNVQNAGLLDSLCFEHDDDVAGTPLKHDDVEITVKAASLNFRDVMTVMNQLPGFDLGFDAAGVVRRVGSSVTRFKIGDRVVMCMPGAHRTVHRAPVDYCELIPDNVTYEEAATIPLVHGTAWYALICLARVSKGESLLIHAAAGGVGQAAIQIAKHKGMEIFATVGSQVKRTLLREKYGIPDDHIFNSRDTSFAADVKRMTGGRGVDVVLNSLSGEALRMTWTCIAPMGTFIEVGLKDILGNSRLEMKPFLQNATFTFFDLKYISLQKREVMADIMRGIFDLQRQGVTTPIGPVEAFKASEIESAFRLMQAGKHIGKIVFSISDDDIVPVLERHELRVGLDPQAVYMLSGGLGGLGRSISKMLVDNGARKLCFLSRSGAKSEAAQKLVADLQKEDVEVLVIPCDVADPAEAAEAVRQCTEKLGRIAGVIQCAMVLRDTLFRNMTHDQWIESIRPKVQGTWNLHKNLPKVDFFVSLSSFTNIFGNRGQSNYAAGGAYQDAVAHLRHSLGMSASTLDVGVMRDVGVLAEQGMSNTLKDFEIPYGLREHELLSLIKLAASGNTPGGARPQILTGLATAGSAAAAGVPPAWYLDDAKFSIMAKTGVKEAAGAKNENSVQAQLAEAKSRDEAAGIVLDALVDRVAKMLQTSAAEIDTNRFLHSYGIDSLVAIEVVNWALRECKAQISVLDLMAAVPITLTARKIASKSALLGKD